MMTILLVSSTVQAATDEGFGGPLPGDIFYSFKLFAENIRLLFTRNVESRAELLGSLAEMRGQEIAYLALQEIDDELVAKTLQRQEELLEKVSKLLDEADLSDDTFNKALDSQVKVLDVLTATLAKVSVRAQEVISENIMRRGEKILLHMERKQEKVQAAVTEKIDEAVLNAIETASDMVSSKANEAKDRIIASLEQRIDKAAENVANNLQKRLQRLRESMTA